MCTKSSLLLSLKSVKCIKGIESTKARNAGSTLPSSGEASCVSQTRWPLVHRLFQHPPKSVTVKNNMVSVLCLIGLTNLLFRNLQRPAQANILLGFQKKIAAEDGKSAPNKIHQTKTKTPNVVQPRCRIYLNAFIAA